MQNSPSRISAGFFYFGGIVKKKLKKGKKKSLFLFSSRCQNSALFVVSKNR